jgi:hypothetical protein
MAATMASSLSKVPSPSMNDLAILRILTGALELGQGGIAGAEVVDGQTDTHRGYHRA